MRPLNIGADDRPAPARGGEERAANPRARREPLIRLVRGSGRQGAAAWYRRPVVTLAAAAALALGGGAAAIWQTGAADAGIAALEHGLREATLAAGFRVAAVNVVGRDGTSREALLAAVGIGRGDPILFFDAEAARARIEAIPWVRQAAVRRLLPDTVLIELAERVPYARWQQGGRTVLVDREGKVLAGADAGRYRHLRRVVGPGAAERAESLFELLAVEPALFARVKDAVRVRDRRWDLALDNGVVVMLPEEGTELAWRHLATLEREKRLLAKAIVAIDLRLPENLVVRMMPEAVPQPPAPPRKADGKKA